MNQQSEEDGRVSNIVELPICKTCKGLLWVCENHNDKPWNGDCCGGAGQPCDCNNNEIVEDPRGFEREIEL